jgi:hypothetical protein
MPIEHRGERRAAVALRLAALPIAAMTALAIVVLGPPLGELLSPGDPPRFWPGVRSMVQPEPVEHARFLIALLAPLLLAGATAWLVRRPRWVDGPAAVRIAGGAELATALALVACVVLQWTATLPAGYARSTHVVYFSLATLAVASMGGVAVVAVMRRRAVVAWIARLTDESPVSLTVAVVVVLVAIALTALPGIVTDASILNANGEFVYHVRFVYDEAMAVLDGRSPLGDFAAQYSSLWPYATGGAMWLFGSSLLVFTLCMAILFGSSMLALFALLRRVTRSAPVAAVLVLPLIATSAFRLHGESVPRFSLVNYFGTMPLRYAGPFLLAWIVGRHLGGARPRRAWPLFLAAGLVAANNVEFGLPAFAALLAALLWAGPRRAARLRELALDGALGLAAAGALVTLLLLVRTGSPPDLSLLFRYSRVFAIGGFGMLPLRPVLGLSTVVFVTYVAAVGVATVRTLQGEPDRLLTGMLAWSGVFGLGAGAYYAGRSIAELLTNMFPAWGLAIVLLTIAVVRALAARGGIRPRPLELACLVGFGMIACSLAQTPPPLAQLDVIRSRGPEYVRHPAGEAYVAALVRRDEPVLLLPALGHRIAVNLGIDDVDPYTGAESIQTEEQLVDALGALHAAGGEKVFVDPTRLPAGFAAALERRGVRMVDGEANSFQLWSARRCGWRPRRRRRPPPPPARRRRSRTAASRRRGRGTAAATRRARPRPRWPQRRRPRAPAARRRSRPARARRPRPAAPPPERGRRAARPPRAPRPYASRAPPAARATRARRCRRAGWP